MELPPLQPASYQSQVFRNIFANASGRHILDDICGAKDRELVERLIQLTSGIDHRQPQFHRPFQYGTVEDAQILAVFQKENWNYGRFGDGKTYGVWYGAEQEETSVLEACWVSYRLAQDNVSPRNGVYTGERAMYTALIQSESAVDLTGEKDWLEPLVDSTDYSFGQALGKKMFESRFQMIRTPSARKVGGICTPIFSPEAINHPQRIYYLKINVYPDGSIGVDSSREMVRFFLKGFELQNPYR